MKSTNKTFTRVSSMLRQAQDLRKRRATIAKSLEEVDAKIADIELEWNDLQKEIAVSIFGMGTPGSVTMTSAGDPAPKKTNKKRIKRRAKKTTKRRTKNSPMSREEIRAAAAARDEKVFGAIKGTPGLNFQAIEAAVKDGTKSQIQTSLKRLKDSYRIDCIGTGRNAVYKTFGRKRRAKKGRK